MKQKLIYILLFVFIVLANPVKGHKDTTSLKKQISLSGGVYNNSIFRFEPLEGAGYFADGPAVRYGLSFELPMDDQLWMGFGLHYLKARNVYHSPAPENEDEYTLNQVSEIIYLPVTWRYDLTSWFAMRVGLTIEIEFQHENSLNQNGLGVTGGAVIHHSPLPWLDIGLEPNLHLTSMLPIPQEFYQQHFFLTGFNSYVALRF
jgi:hypothetical protein